MPFRVEREEIASDARSATVEISAPSGIFACYLSLRGHNFNRLVLIVRDQKYWEGVLLQPTDAKQPEIDLARAKGVKISSAGKHCRIEFDAAGLKLIQPSSRFQFINQYR